MSKLNIVQVLPELDEGGVEGEALDLAGYLADAGHRSLVISAGGRMVKQLEESGGIHITWPHIGEKSFRCLKYIQKLRRYLLQEKVDILHLRSRLPAWLGYLAWKSLPHLMRPTLVTTFHGFYSINRYSTVMTKGERVIAVSKVIVDHIIKNYKMDPARIELIHGGCDTKLFDPAVVTEKRKNLLKKQWGIPDDDRPVIVLPGRLTQWKGQDVFVDALERLRDLDFLALCIGESDRNSTYAKRLIERIKRVQLQDKVRLVGHCNDMPAAFSIADLVVSASSSQPEAFGKVAIEAMAMAKPVLSTRHGGSLETILENKTGWFVPPSDAEKMAEMIREVAFDKETLARAGERGRKWVLENFTSLRMCEKTLDLYARLHEEKEAVRSGKKLTVVQMIPELEDGGVERGTLEMGKHLADQGHTSIVVSAGGRLVKQLEEEGSEHIRWPVGVKNLRCLLYILPLRRMLLRKEVTILHLRSRMPAWIGYITWLSLPKQKRPVLVTTFHGFYSLNSYSAIMTKGDGVIAVSEGIRKHIHENYNVKNEVRLIFRGVDEDLFNPENVSASRVKCLREKWQVPDNMPVLMLPGRITRWKGQDIFLKSLLKITNKQYKALLVGALDANQGYGKELIELVDQHKLHDRVSFVGHCDDMAACLMLADIVFSASSSEPEAFGRTTVEAMSMGKPVIATAHGGSLETVIGGETGWLVPPSDIEAMGECINNALSNPERLQKLGHRGQEHVRKNFTTRSMCDKTVLFYRELLQAKREEYGF